MFKLGTVLLIIASALYCAGELLDSEDNYGHGYERSNDVIKRRKTTKKALTITPPVNPYKKEIETAVKELLESEDTYGHGYQRDSGLIKTLPPHGNPGFGKKEIETADKELFESEDNYGHGYQRTSGVIKRRHPVKKQKKLPPHSNPGPFGKREIETAYKELLESEDNYVHGYQRDNGVIKTRQPVKTPKTLPPPNNPFGKKEIEAADKEMNLEGTLRDEGILDASNKGNVQLDYKQDKRQGNRTIMTLEPHVNPAKRKRVLN